MRLFIRHTTRYEFANPVAHGLQRLRLKPKPTHGQQVIEWRMELEGAPLANFPARTIPLTGRVPGTLTSAVEHPGDQIVS